MNIVVPSLGEVLRKLDKEDKEQFYAQINSKSEKLIAEQGWSNKAAKAYKKELDKLIAEEQLRQQTEMFWFLQMQFLSMNEMYFWHIARSLMAADVYVVNDFSKKIEGLMNMPVTYWTEDDFACLCTHFALQLSGIEE